MNIELKGYKSEHLDELAQLVAVAGNNTTGLDASRKGLEARLRYPRLIPERDLITAWDTSTNRMIGYALVFAGADIKASTVALGIAPSPKVTEPHIQVTLSGASKRSRSVRARLKPCWTVADKSRWNRALRS